MSNAIEKLAEQVSDASNLEELTQPILDVLQRVTHLESTYVTTIHEQEGVQRILYSRNSGELQIPEGLEVPWSDTLCRRALDEKRFLTTDVPSVWGDSEAAAALGLKTYLSNPIYTDEGELFGTLCGASATTVEVSDAAMEVLALFSRMIGHQASREQLAREATARAHAAETRASDMQFVAEIGALCLSGEEPDQVLKAVSQSFKSRQAWQYAAPFLLPEVSPISLDQTVNGIDASHLTTPEMLATEDGPMLPLLIEMLNMARYSEGYAPTFLSPQHSSPELRAVAERSGIGNECELFVLTLAHGTDLMGGVLLISQPGGLDATEKTMVQSCWQTLTLFAEREVEHEMLEVANAQLTLHARHDPLTGLPNRRYLVEEMRRMLSHATRAGEVVYVAFIDLDGFKKINDQHGHDVGDDFLEAMAHCLKKAARTGDLTARYGGDEFVMVAVNDEPATEQARQAIAVRIEQAMSGVLKLPTLTLDYPGPSVGVVAWQGDKVPDADELIAKADKAMYVVKQARRAERA